MTTEQYTEALKGAKKKELVSALSEIATLLDAYYILWTRYMLDTKQGMGIIGAIKGKVKKVVK